MIKEIKRQLLDPGFKRYLANTSWFIGEKSLRLVGALLIGVWVARYLGPDELGILSYAQSIVALFLSFSTLGLKRILVRELVRRPKEYNILLGTSFFLQTVGSVLLLLLLFLAIYFLGVDDFSTKIILILGSVTFFQSLNVIGLYFEGNVQSKYIALSGAFSLLFSSAAKVFLILIKAPLIWFVYVIAFESILNSVFLVFFYTKKGNTLFAWKFSKIEAVSLIKDSWPLLLSGIIVSIYMKIDQVMIKEFMDNEAVGEYAAAVRLSEAWYFMPTVITASLFPAIVNAKKTNESLYYNRLQNLYDLMFYLSLGIALPITFLGDPLIVFLYGKAFLGSSIVLKIHIWAGIFVFLGVSRGGWIVNENLQKFSSLYLGIGMLSNVLLNILLIPIYGIKGAAVATLIAQSISVLFAPIIFKQTRLSFYMMAKSLLFISLFKNIKAWNSNRRA